MAIVSALSTKHLLGIKYIQKQDIETIFQTADNFKEVLNRPVKKVPSLRDVTIANLFFENSTRTKMSFELAEKRLSADVINFSASSSSVKKGEIQICCRRRRTYSYILRIRLIGLQSVHSPSEKNLLDDRPSIKNQAVLCSRLYQICINMADRANIKQNNPQYAGFVYVFFFSFVTRIVFLSLNS